MLGAIRRAATIALLCLLFPVSAATAQQQAQDCQPAREPPLPPLTYPERLARSDAEALMLGQRLQALSFAFTHMQDNLLGFDYGYYGYDCSPYWNGYR
jgi:hypothetical protein